MAAPKRSAKDGNGNHDDEHQPRDASQSFFYLVTEGFDGVGADELSDFFMNLFRHVILLSLVKKGYSRR